MDTPIKGRAGQSHKVEVNYPVLFLTADGPLQGETRNLSPSSAFVRCRNPLRLNDITSMSIEISEHESLLAEVEVIWSNIYGPDDDITPRGMIVSFTSLTPNDRLRLRNVIAEHYQRKTSRLAKEKQTRP